MLRSALVLAVLAALAIAAWRWLTPEAAPAVEPATSGAAAPRAAIEPHAVADAPRAIASVAVDAEDIAVTEAEPSAPPSLLERGCDVTIALASDSGVDFAGDTYLTCTDDRGHTLLERRVDLATYTFEGVPEGAYRLSIYAPNHAQSYATFEVEAGEREKRIPVVLRWIEQRPVLVRWQTDDGRPFVEALATAWTFQDRVKIGVRTASGGGISFVIPHAAHAHRIAADVARGRHGAPADSFAIVLGGEGPDATIEGILDGRAIARATVPPGADELVLSTSVREFFAGLGGLRGRVVSATDGAPVAAFRANLEAPDRYVRRPKLIGSGIFVHENLPPGRLHLRVSDGNGEVVREVAIEPGLVTDVGDVVVSPVRPIELWFVDPHGDPIARAQYEPFSGADTADGGPRITPMRTAAAGRGWIAAPPEPVFLLARADGFGLTRIDVPPSAERGDEVTVRLQRGFEVVLDVGLGDGVKPVRLETGDGVALGVHTTLPTGLLRLELAPGAYRARRSATDEGTLFRVEREPIVLRLR